MHGEDVSEICTIMPSEEVDKLGYAAMEEVSVLSVGWNVSCLGYFTPETLVFCNFYVLISIRCEGESRFEDLFIEIYEFMDEKAFPRVFGQDEVLQLQVIPHFVLVLHFHYLIMWSNLVFIQRNHVHFKRSIQH